VSDAGETSDQQRHSGSSHISRTVHMKQYLWKCKRRNARGKFINALINTKDDHAQSFNVRFMFFTSTLTLTNWSSSPSPMDKSRSVSLRKSYIE